MCVYMEVASDRISGRGISCCVTLEGKEEGSLKAKRSLLVRDATEGMLVTTAKQHKLASD